MTFIPPSSAAGKTTKEAWTICKCCLRIFQQLQVGMCCVDSRGSPSWAVYVHYLGNWMFLQGISDHSALWAFSSLSSPQILWGCLALPVRLNVSLLDLLCTLFALLPRHFRSFTSPVQEKVLLENRSNTYFGVFLRSVCYSTQAKCIENNFVRAFHGWKVFGSGGAVELSPFS